MALRICVGQCPLAVQLRTPMASRTLARSSHVRPTPSCRRMRILFWPPVHLAAHHVALCQRMPVSSHCSDTIARTRTVPDIAASALPVRSCVRDADPTLCEAHSSCCCSMCLHFAPRSLAHQQLMPQAVCRRGHGALPGAAGLGRLLAGRPRSTAAGLERKRSLSSMCALLVVSA